MAEFKTLQGILAMVDIVNFTGQASKLGEKFTAQYTAYFQKKINGIVGKYDFQVIKFLGDAALIFGTEPGNLLEIMLDLFERDIPEDKFGFISRFRMVAHTSYFQFQMKGDQPIDLVSAEGIKVFRMEKYAAPWELMATHELYPGIKSLLTEKNIEVNRMELKESLKGFDNEEWFPPFYKLTIAEKEIGASNLLEQRMDALARDVEYIPVFGNLYQPVPMDQNFINLSILCDRDRDAREECDEFEEYKRKRKEDDWIFHERLERRSRVDFIEIDVDTLYENRNKRYTGGVIFGLPGAGKTTILRHLAHKEFNANKRRKPDRKKVVLFVPCRDIPFYDNWYKDQYGTEAVVMDVNTALEYMTWVFLFGSKGSGALKPEELVEYRNAAKKVKQAFKENRLTLLVDALDEAPDSPAKERIKELVLLLTSENRLFLTSRPSERIHLRQEKLPEFNVLSLTMDQVRAVARHLMDPGSFIYKQFDEAIWKEEIVVKMAATPITALLVTAYFQAYGQFDHRFPMYDLLLKFILVKVWENIKTDTFPYKNLELFFKEVKKIGFFEKYEDAGVMYDGLGSLCFRLFFEGSGGKVHQMVNDETLKRHFNQVIAERFHYDENQLAAFVEEWIERFQQYHLLLQAGAREYVFIHPTIMEYLAAFYMIQQARKDMEKLPALVWAALKKEDYLQLESVPIAAGSDLLKGFAILAVVRDMEVEYARELLCEFGVKCLSEVEWQISKTFEAIRIESLKRPVLNLIHKNRGTFNWLYEYLKEVVLTGDKSRLKEESIERLYSFLKLSRINFLEEYLDYEAFDSGDSELVGLRKKLLFQLVQKELVEQWLKVNEKTREEMEKEYDNVLQLDSPGYHPEDKNFNYFRDIVGKQLIGFFGSPNLRHLSFVLYCVFSPDGKTILSASDDKTLKLWDSLSGKEIRIFSGHKSTVWSCAFSPDGKTILSASGDKTLKLWDAESGKEIKTYSGYSAPVISCTFSPGGDRILSSSSLDNTLKLWDAESGKEICVFTGHYGYVLSCAFSPDGTLILSASRDRTLKLWDVESGKEIRTFTGHKDYIRDCAFSPEGKQILSASIDTTLKIWDVDTGEEIRTFSGHKAAVESCGFSPDGTTLVSASEDNTLKLWDVATGKEIHSFSGHKNTVYSCGFSPDGKTMVSASRDNTLKLWDGAEGKEIRSFSGHKYAVSNCVFSPEGNTLVSASLDNTLKLWDVETGKGIRCFSGHKYAVSSCVFSPDGKTLVSASEDYTLKLWDVETGKEIRTFSGHQSAVWSCVLSPDGKTLASASNDHTLKLWDVVGGKEIRTFSGHQSAIWGCVFSPVGNTLVSASEDNSLKLWDVETGKEIRTFSGHKDAVYSCVFSPVGNTLVSASNDKTLKLWDVETGKEICTFIGHKDGVSSCVFSQEGDTLVSASDDKTLKLWDVETGKEIHSVKLPWIPRYVSVSPTTPHRVITANQNGTVTMFEFEELKGK